MKNVLAIIVQAATSQQLSYTNAEFKHSDQNDAVLEFVDFWKEGQGVASKWMGVDIQFAGGTVS